MQFTARFVTSLSAINKVHWQALFASANPFTQYDYLLALEQSQCVCDKTGWQPYHLVIEVNNNVVAIMPLYIKSHSYGEYMFDWSWAEAYQQHGFSYYPKLINAIPFTPVSGQRLAINSDFSELNDEILSFIHQALLEQAEKLQLSNIQCLFNQQTDLTLFSPTNKTQQANGNCWLKREDVQFHWFNRNYQHFDDFLSVLTSRKRKNIKKERQKVSEQGIYFEHILASEVSDELWLIFFKFYQMTYAKRSGHFGYLSLECFKLWAEHLSEKVILVVAKKSTNDVSGADKVIAASLFFYDDDNLYGRYWGCLDEYDFLHFETCYYQGIELAIKLGLSCFNAGAQGEHKVARGFEPVVTYGHYLLLSSPFKDAIGDFLVREQNYHQEYRQAIKAKLPFKLA